MKYIKILLILFVANSLSAQTWADYHNKSFKGKWFLKSEAGIRNSSLINYTLDNFTWYARPGIGYRHNNFDFEGGIGIFENIDGYTDQRLWQKITRGFKSFDGSLFVMAEQIASRKYNVRYRVGFFAEKRFFAFSTETLYLTEVENRTWIYGKFEIPLFDIYIGVGGITKDKFKPSIRLTLKSTN